MAALRWLAGFLTICFLTVGLLLAATPGANATTYYVSPAGSDSNAGTSDAPFLTIQKGLTTALSGDTVMLAAGTYAGTGNVGLDTGGKGLTVTAGGAPAAAVIDCGGSARAFLITNGEAVAISNLTLENGSAATGGAVSVSSGGTLTLTNCLLTDNTASSSGGAVFNQGTATLEFCTFTGNQATTGAGGAVENSGGTLSLTDDILWGDTSGGGNPEMDSGGSVVSHCDVQGGFDGTGNLNADPLFADAADSDFHLLAGSPAIAAGTPLGGFPTDKDGVARHSPPTLGCYEGFEARTYLLWHKASGTTSLWRVSADGTYTHTEYGPYAGWTASALSETPDGAARLLWNHTSGQASVWNVATDGTFTQHTYGPYAGWTAVSLSTNAAGMTHLLWDKADGTASVWTLDTVAGTFTQTSFGPYPGWTATATADGPVNTDLLWTNTNGQVSGWRVSLDSGSPSKINSQFGPFGGWSAAGVSVGPDSMEHLLWNDVNGQAALWQANFSAGTFDSTEYSHFSGWSTQGIVTDAADVTHLLWSHAPDGETSLWDVGSSGYTHREYGPYPGWSSVAVAVGP